MGVMDGLLRWRVFYFLKKKRKTKNRPPFLVWVIVSQYDYLFADSYPTTFF